MEKCSLCDKNDCNGQIYYLDSEHVIDYYLCDICYNTKWVESIFMDCIFIYMIKKLKNENDLLRELCDSLGNTAEKYFYNPSSYEEDRNSHEYKINLKINQLQKDIILLKKKIKDDRDEKNRADGAGSVCEVVEPDVDSTQSQP